VSADLLLFPRWLVPVIPARQVLIGHAIAVREGIITDILPREAAIKHYPHVQSVELDEHVLLPGLVNSHTHAAMSLFRGMADDLPLAAWLNDHMWPAEQWWVSADVVRDGTRLALAEMIRSGTTCFADMYFFADETAALASAAGMRAVIGLIVIDFATAWAGGAQEYFLKAGQVHHKFRNTPLITTAFAPHSPYAVSGAALQQVNTLAVEMDIPVLMHLQETADEVTRSIRQHGVRPLARLESLGLLGPRLLAVHMTQVEEREFELLHRYRVNVVHCPESNLKLASGFCPVQRLLENGINVSLGSDGAASNNDLDMVGERRSAALLAKGVSGDCRAVDAFTALEMATINGARALGLQDAIGSLEKGKQADMIALDLGEIETRPLRDPVAQIVYSASRNQVSDVWVAGRPLMAARRLLTINEGQVKQLATRWQEKLYGEAASPPKSTPG